MHDYKYDKPAKCNICKYCGATDYGGFYWLVGYRSKTEPPCEYDGHNFDEWKKSAEKPPHDFDD